MNVVGFNGIWLKLELYVATKKASQNQISITVGEFR